MKKDLTNKEALEATRKHFGCAERGCEFCQFDLGEGSSYDNLECGAEEFYDGYVQALKDKGGEKKQLRPFDMVRISKSYIKAESKRRNMDEESRAVGMITETDGETASVHWFDHDGFLHSAWWDDSELEVIGNCMTAIANEMAHPFGTNTEQGDEMFQ